MLGQSQRSHHRGSPALLGNDHSHNGIQMQLAMLPCVAIEAYKDDLPLCWPRVVIVCVCVCIMIFGGITTGAQCLQISNFTTCAQHTIKGMRLAKECGRVQKCCSNQFHSIIASCPTEKRPYEEQHGVLSWMCVRGRCLCIAFSYSSFSPPELTRMVEYEEP
eukprot:126297-Pelagomonas_calceolata.AAC.12